MIKLQSTLFQNTKRLRIKGWQITKLLVSFSDPLYKIACLGLVTVSLYKNNSLVNILKKSKITRIISKQCQVFTRVIKQGHFLFVPLSKMLFLAFLQAHYYERPIIDCVINFENTWFIWICKNVRKKLKRDSHGSRFGPGGVWPSWIGTWIWNMPNEKYTYRDNRNDLV